MDDNSHPQNLVVMRQWKEGVMFPRLLLLRNLAICPRLRGESRVRILKTEVSDCFGVSLFLESAYFHVLLHNIYSLILCLLKDKLLHRILTLCSLWGPHYLQNYCIRLELCFAVFLLPHEVMAVLLPHCCLVLPARMQSCFFPTSGMQAHVSVSEV